MSVLAVICAELREARAANRELVRVRVHASAITGSPVSVPINGRSLGFGLAPSASTNALELVLHPSDWVALRFERGLGTPYAVTVDISTGRESVLGLPVVRALTAGLT